MVRNSRTTCNVVGACERWKYIFSRVLDPYRDWVHIITQSESGTIRLSDMGCHGTIGFGSVF
jgi:hypothetical protein